MKSTRSIFVAAAVSVVVLGISLSLPARLNPQGAHKIRYIVKDIGSLGGSFASAGGISNTGWVVGYSLLPGDNVVHEFLWHDGVMKDLGTLGGPNSFSEYRLNDFGNAGGESDTITPDANGEDFCAFGTQLICLPFYLQNGKKIPQPLLGGNNGSASAPTISAKWWGRHKTTPWNLPASHSAKLCSTSPSSGETAASTNYKLFQATRSASHT